MDKFDEWYRKTYGSLLRFERQNVAWKAWQESRKQAVAEAALMDQHTRESHEEKGALVERERIVGVIREYASEMNKLADLIEKD